jgi:hypothetical protein
MTVLVRAIIPAVQAVNAQTTQYTAPATTRTIIDKFTGTNTTGAPATLTINLVNSGGAAGVANQIVQKVFAAGECYTFPEVVGHVLNPGDFISTLDSVNNAITLRSSGREVT